MLERLRLIGFSVSATVLLTTPGPASGHNQAIASANSMTAEAPAPRLSDDGWSSEFNLPGLRGWVHSVAQYRGDLIVGGSISGAGKPEIEGIARWDGRQWQALGDNADSRPHAVWTMTVYQGDLIAGGSIRGDDGLPAVSIARWDGNDWHPLGSGLAYSGVYSMIVHEGRLVVGGWFSEAGGVTAHSIAAWDGQSWSPLGNINVGPVRAMTVYRGDLFAAGDVVVTGPDSIPRIIPQVTRWDGTEWHPLTGAFESIPQGSVNALAVYHDRLIAGGNFHEVHGAPGTHLAAWNGESWSGLGLSFQGRPDELGVTSLRLLGEDLIIAGDFQTSDRAITDLAFWDGTTLSQFGLPIAGSCHESAPNDYRPWNTVEAIGEFDGDFVVVGCFQFAGQTSANSVARWDGRSWRPFGSGHGLGGYGPRGGLVHDGLLVTYTLSRPLSVFDGNGWRSLGPADSLDVSEAIVFNGKLIALGSFPDHTTGGTMMWSGEEWIQIHDRYPSAITVFEGQLYAAIVDDWRATRPKTRVFRYDGTAWTELPGIFDGSIATLGGVNGTILAGGDFQSVDGRDVRALAQWNGNYWVPFGNGFTSVTNLTTYQGLVVAAGYMPTDEEPTIAQWIGYEWRPLRGGLDPLAAGSAWITALTTFKGTLLAGGSFELADGTRTGLAAWDGDEWYDFGQTTSGIVRGFASTEEDLYVFGSFGGVGGRPAYGVARWSPNPDVSFGVTWKDHPAIQATSPNPFRTNTVLSYAIPRRGHARISIYSIAGRLVTTLDDGIRSIGEHVIDWNGLDASGLPVPAGMYLARVEVDGVSGGARKVMKLR